MLSLVSSCPLAFQAPSLAPPVAQARASVSMETRADLEVLAKELNPIVGFW